MEIWTEVNPSLHPDFVIIVISTMPIVIVNVWIVKVYLNKCLCNLLGFHQEIYDERVDLPAAAGVSELTEVGPVVLEVFRVLDLVAQPGVELHPSTEVDGKVNKEDQGRI